MRIAIAQLNPTIGDVEGNARQILAAAQQAAATGARLLLTPELSIAGYPPRDLLMRPSFIDAMAEAIAQLAQALPPDLAVLVGTAARNNHAFQRGEKALFNSIVLLAEGTVQYSFHKRLLPTYDVFDDERYFQPASQPQDHHHSFNWDGYSIGVTICEDLWNDEKFWGKRTYVHNPLADLAEQGVDLIVNLSGSPYYLGKQRLREAMLSHAAARYKIPILYVNQVGGNDDLVFDGNSVGFNGQGELVYRAPAFKPALQQVELGKQPLDLVTGAIAPVPESDEAELWAALVMGVKDYAHKCGFSSAVLGLSGGIDSALVAAIATAALGPAHVLAVLMPSPHSSDHSISDAVALAKNLGIATHQLAIGSLMEGYDHTLKELFAGREAGVAEENIQSRIRGNLLMAIANKFGHLLLSTGNKSEMAVGYCTLYGDMNGGLAVIADVPKTRVYSLCRWLNQPDQLAIAIPQRPSTAEIIPTHILTKPPSAELKPGQVDQDSLPSYDILDGILERLVNQHQSPAALIKAGYDAAIVTAVAKLVKRAEFKRRQAPPGLKVTDRAFGTGWRMPIAARYE